ncbi:amino acid adenylation domain-containing protein [Rhodococcus sp. BP-252]|uniref:non-ribosomal peptide synthetase n=1 Tax=unclassified Rhodococcus (in: high G+C Gram-positive bacteria) TaxID=192944 RepID=UPI001C9B6CD5|nr:MULTISPECIES: non-ribosomal peptide synthetase [unclassified Rhodococcus (in: high G+C Gram-positive bacteria)]MBY6410481.1 amino acid adenylation domain-containing protein [Rhodococcus sp. BP-320]MBY6416363.1 amino acid adenylation domain-containing protein [Rhodococcus sp. BP-321]MBY6420358.1 amino acid adenylation domain-containing protein [Rhodococcus sp. BP-324]MBY6425037.1 amino acid adenylation domain-containing protein [Rhodococcus sp. BP-323]MBY6430257.1 amino acid adenylation doma
MVSGGSGSQSAAIEDLPGLVGRVAAGQADRVAVAVGSSTVTYGDLHREIGNLDTAMGGVLGADALVPLALSTVAPGAVEAADGGLEGIVASVVADAREVLGEVAAVPVAETLVSRFRDQVERTPDAVAVTFDGTELTYAEFDGRVNRLARRLVELGVGPDVRVGLSISRSLDLLVAMYAISAAGGAYVPIDPGHPADRIGYVVDIAEPILVLTTSTEDVALPGDVRALNVDTEDLAQYASEPLVDDERNGALDPANTAYVIFTSGSTGRPKGVAVSHEAIVANLDWRQADYPLTADDVVLQKTPFTFDVSVWEFFWPLQAGARLVVAAPDGHRDPAYIAETMSTHGVTTAHFVPSMLSVFLGQFDSDQAPTIPSLRQVFASGEALPASTTARFHEVFDAELHNLYGPTEAAVDVTYHRTDSSDLVSVPIGVAVPRTGLHVLGEGLDRTPPGVPGELYLSGVQLARGYIARPDLTADRFVADPYSDSGERMYRTGDLVRWNTAGVLEYLGRTDFQVKLRGLRIELGEIEAALLAQETVRQAVVVVRSDDSDSGVDDQLVAYLVTTTGEADSAALAAGIRGTLPDYMVPAVFVVLDEFPLNASGKLDRKALPTPDVTLAAAEYRAPATEVERTLVAVFEDILGAERVGVDDDFFALGGNSLSATRAIARVGAELSIKLDVRAFFDAPTVAGLAKSVDVAQADGSSAREPLTKRERPDVVPLSMAQQRMWFLNRLDPNSAVDNIPVAIRLSGLLDVDALQAAIYDVVDRHEALRTVYPEVDGVGRQVVRETDDAAPDLLPERVDETALYGRVVDVVSQGFDVTAEVPVRLRLLQVSPTEHVLILVAHHIAADGFSMLPLTRDVVTAYAARSDGNAPGWAPLAVQYADFALWQRAVLGSEDDPQSLISAQERFWRGALADLPEQLDLPSDRRRPAVASGRGATYATDIDASLRSSIEALATTQSATPFMVVHAALSVLLARLSGTEDIAVGTPVAGRGEEALDDLVGMFVNTLVLRAVVDPADPFTDLLAAVRRSDLDAFGNADVPFERLVEVLDPPRSRAHHPLFQVLLVFQNLGTTSLELPGLTVSGVEFDTAVAKTDLQVTVSENDAQWKLEFTYATDLFDESTIATLASRLIGVLHAVTTDAGTVVGDIELIDSAERTTVLETWNVTSHDVTDEFVLDAFHRMASSTPDAVALSFDDETVTYREFRSRVTTLARHLVTLGVGPDILTAVAIRRSVDMVVALYAVIEAGGAYVPIDPDQPAERNDYILDVSEAPVVLTTTRDVFVAPRTNVVRIDTLDLSDYRAEPLVDADRRGPTHPDQLAYVIFTSGSTGRPKGVAVPHRAVVNQIAWIVNEYGLGGHDVVLQKTPFTFDVSVWELFGAPASGARMVIARPDGHRDATYLADVVEQKAVTATSFVPSMVPVFTAEMAARDASSLRLIQLAGEALPASVVTGLARAADAQVHNLYGPTEFTVHATSRPVAGVDGRELHDTTAPMGTPVWNTAAYVLDGRLNPTPVGVAGELYLAGVQTARGYHGRSTLTAERFVADPFGGGRMYRTGDLVRWNASGELEYIGRTDFQVKLRGLRIELGEIETVARTAPSVSDAVAVVKSDRLVLYVVAGTPVDLEELRRTLAAELPSYMVPAAFVVLDALPTNAAGKLDRAKLPEPELQVRAFRAPSTPVEEIIASVFGDVLGVERVGADDDFFALGGNSLIATQVVSRLGAALDTTVPVRLLFEVSTVASLAVRIESEVGKGARVPLTPQERPDHVPLSMAQQRMWFLNRLDPESAVNNIPVAIRLSGLLDRHALHVAVADVLSRHESLRTVYPEIDGVGYQEVVSTRSVIPDLAPIPVDAEQLAASIEETVLAGFDVTTRAPFRASLFEVSSTEHVLVFVAHHIAADGYSLGPLTRDIVRAYTARAAGLDLDWEPLPVQYADYALWQREVLGSEDDPESVISAQKEFWQKTLAGAPEQLDLPFDRPRPAVASGRGTSHRFDIDASLRSAVENLASAERATPFMVVHAALSVLLARLSGTDDIAVGAPIAGRGDAALDDMIGMFVNTLVLRTRVDAPARFDEVLAQVRESDLAAFANADIPFERLVEILDPARSTARHPLFQVALFFQNLGRSELDLPNLSVSAVDFDAGTAKFDLQVAVSEPAEGDGWSVEFNYATDLFDLSGIELLQSRFLAVLEAVTTNPASVVGDIDVTTEPERDALLRAWNATDHELPAALLLDGFDAVAAERPDATALVYEGVSLTYGELSERVDSLATVLTASGAGPETRVALAVRRSVDLVVAMYAVLRSGAAYVPIDPDHPAERIGYILDAAAPVCVLTRSEDEFTPPVDVPVVDVHARPESGATFTPPLLSPDSVAYVIFTSGSTGRPKGVAVSHRAIVNQMQWMQSEYRLGAADVYLQKTATTFDVSLWGFFLPLRVGATLVLATPDGHRDPAYLADVIARHAVTVTDFVPTMLSVFAAAVTRASIASLRQIFVIGEALPGEAVRDFARVSSARVHNLYGPTEAAVSITYADVTDTAAGAAVTIGVPEWNSAVYVLDSRLHPVPVGVPGELYLAGVQLARGYHGRVDLTSDRFVANPFSEHGARMYRTGDLVEWRADGTIDYIGRTDFQVKFRGQRIELGEIEAALAAHPSVGLSAAAVVATDAGDQLVGYVVPAGTDTVDTDALRAALGQTLPTYMVPGAIVVLAEFPLNTSGKLDRKALPAPEFAARQFRAPSTPVEEIVAGIFAEVLGVERVGLDDDFFALGGNSLVATQVVSRLGAALDSSVPVRTLFEAPTVEALAAGVESHTGGRVALTAMPRPDRIPLSLAQQRMWFLNRLDPGSAVNNIPAAVRLTGTLDVDALTAAIDDVVARHEILRTVYPESDGTGIQVVMPVASGRTDFRVETVAEADLFDVVTTLVTEGFDVTRRVPLRIRLLEVGENEHVLVVVAYHIAADGFSMIPLMRDVITAYVSRARGEEPGWTPLPVQYADYTLWQREVLGSPDEKTSLISKQETYWTTALAGLDDEIELPTDRARPSASSGRGAAHSLTLDETTTAAIDRVAAERGVTPFMVVHAALAVLLSRVSGSEDVAVGTPVAGRGEAALDDVIGMFVNTLVLRTQIDGSQSFGDVLAQAREVDLSAFAHADLPFERVVEVLDPPRVQGRHPLVQVLLTFQNFSSSSFELPGLTAAAVDFDSAVAKMDLQVTVSEPHEQSDGTRGRSVEMVYATDLFDADTITELGRQFVAVLHAVTADIETAVGDIELVDAGELHWLVRGVNATDHAVDPSATLVSMFDAQVARTPDAPALTFDGRTITYAQFDARANRLARYLIGRGVGPESTVAVAIGRSFELMVGIYAVLKAGAAYVPVDPSQPTERIAYILDTARVALTLTTTRDRGDFGSELPIVIDDLDVAEFSDAPVTDAERRRPVSASDAAYVLFTSGSTGKPKGVAIEHRAIVNRLVWMQAEYALTPADHVVQKTPTTFDVSVWELFWPLQIGARLVIARPDGHRDPVYMARLIEAEGVTVAHFVPSMLGVFASEPAASAAGSLRWVFASGEALPYSTAKALSDVLPSTTLVNLYGPTEAAVDVTYHEVTDADTAGVPIGRPVFNTQVYVLDARLRPVAVGAVGELYLGGVQLARGYASRPDLTADRFVADPFGDAGERLYRTGDLVRWNRESELEYIGRSDFQVKLRGLRIELGEIESAVLADESVAQAVVLVRGERLVGYVVPAAGASIDVDTVLTSAAEVLPEYMVPSVLLVLDALPLGPSGKLDRKALPEPVFEAAEFRAPTTDVERIVAEVFAEVLGVPQVGLDDDFFALGGNSLIATQVVSRVGAALDAEIPVRTMFDATTVAAFAATVSELAGTGVRPALTAGPRPERIPLSLAQQRMWVLNHLDPESGAYNIPLAVKLSGDLDTDALGHAVADVVARHESLRTIYPSDADGPQQRILAPADVAFDLTPRAVDSEADATRVVAELVLGGFDVADAVPVRVGLVRLSPREHVLALVVHHISADGASIAPLARDVMVAYSARVAGQAPEWTELPIQYADFALWQRAVLGAVDDADSVAAEQLSYWTKTLAGIPDALDLPTDRPRPATQSMQGRSVDFDLDAESHAQLAAFARDRGASLFMVVHAALAVLLGRLSGSSDVVVGTPVAGRGAAELDELVGMFVNTLALRTEIDLGGTFSGLVDEARTADLGAFGNADVPFENVVDAVVPARSQARHPIFQVALSFQNLERVRLDLPGLTVEGLDAGELGAKFDLQFTVEPRTDADGHPAGLFGSLLYATDLFDEPTARTFGDRFTRILRSVAADPFVIVGDIDIMSEQERALTQAHAAPEAETAPASSVSLDRSLPQVIGSVVELDPDAPAVAVDGEELSYLTVEGRAARLARVLIGRGVGPGDKVVVTVPVSVDWAVAVLATTFTGAAVVVGESDCDAQALVEAVGVRLVLGRDGSDVPEGPEVLEVDDASVVGAVSDASPRPIAYSERTRLLDPSDPAVVVVTGDGTVEEIGQSTLVAALTEANGRYGVTFESRLLAASDAGDAWQLSALLAAGVVGAAWVVPSGDGELADLVLDEWVTHAFVPAADTGELGGDDFEDLDAVVVTDGGSADEPDGVTLFVGGKSFGRMQ